MTIFWFRRDLRLEDNAGLFHALTENETVLPIFIFDTNILAELPMDDARVSFIHLLLEKINVKLSETGKSLAVFHGEPKSIFEHLSQENDITNIYANEDYEPYGINRDREIAQMLSQKNITFKQYKDHVLFAKNEVIKDDKTPYVVFTPFSKRWKEKFAANPIPTYNSSSSLSKICEHHYPFLTLKEIGFTKSNIITNDYDISSNLLRDYELTRNFPALAQTSGLSPHLRFGSISIRVIAALAAKENNQTFLNELIWREFFMQILWHFPLTVSKSFRPKYDNIRWRNNESEFKKWCNGETGYPIVDAGMRQLNTTGLMHNRVRMVTASFLCKHLLIDWRWGEAYFAEKLLDYEQSSNVGNWQWAAGSGVDAAPYFRIFNPSEQVKKFDSELKYIMQWVPELNDFAYPKPMVDHKEARERCLKVYKEALDN